MTKDEKIELILRRTVDIHNKETLLKKLNSGKKLIVILLLIWNQID